MALRLVPEMGRAVMDPDVDGDRVLLHGRGIYCLAGMISDAGNERPSG